MAEIAIRTENLGKQYRLGELDAYKTLRETVADAAVRSARALRPRSRNDHPADRAARSGQRMWALRNVSLEIGKGEAVGIIGRNGAGKTTLLKILSRITPPTEGRAVLRGRIASLLEVGTAFHPELTGRENIYLNGAILGMGKAEITRKYDDIVDFAEIEEFMDTPVKRYSTGMFVRLGFAVAAHLEPEILLVDEVLAVGDVAFQKKCLGRLSDATEGGRTILFVSHNMAAIQGLCSRALLVSSGRIVADGEPQGVIEEYLRSARVFPERNGIIAEGHDRTVDLVGVDFLDDRGSAVDSIVSGQTLTIRLLLRAKETIGRAKVSVGIDNSFGVRIAFLSNDLVGQALVLDQGDATVLCRIPDLPLAPGEYSLTIKVVGPRGELLWSPNSVGLRVETGDFFKSGRMIEKWWIGSALIRHEWSRVGPNGGQEADAPG